MIYVPDFVLYILKYYDFSVISSNNLKIALLSYLTLFQNLDSY